MLSMRLCTSQGQSYFGVGGLGPVWVLVQAATTTPDLIDTGLGNGFAMKVPARVNGAAVETSCTKVIPSRGRQAVRGMEDASMNEAHKRHSPHGRPIRIHHHQQVMPSWVKSRRRAYRLIDVVADAAKTAVRQLVPRPRQTNHAHA